MLDRIVNLLPLDVSNFIILKDLDNICENEKIIGEIMDRGFQIINVEDPEVFRFYYEDEIRPILEKGKPYRKIALILKIQGYIPYDIYEKCSHVEISINKLFPKLSYPVVKSLEVDYLEKLYDSYKGYSGERLGNRGTLNFILNSIYNLDISSINSFLDLIKKVLETYYNGLIIFPNINRYLVDGLMSNEDLASYPLLEVLENKESFFRFMQSQWDNYVSDKLGLGESYGDMYVDFEDIEIRTYMDYFFETRELIPVKIHEEVEIPKFMESGVYYDSVEGSRNRIKKSLDILDVQLDKAENYKDWLRIANLWSEILVELYYSSELIEYFEERVNNLQVKIFDKFNSWLTVDYGKLYSLSYTRQPVMVHKIIWYINSDMKSKRKDKIALILIDGMALDDWKIIRKGMNNNFIIEEKLTFAWIPTVTSISRQSIFSGEIPINFGDTIFSTGYDEKHWKKFWMERGYKQRDIGYIRNVIDFNEKEFEELIAEGKKILGIVINTIDNMLHTEALSKKGVYNRIEFWVKNVKFDVFLEKLLNQGYDIYITSDHGNIETIGVGSPKEGLLVDKAGQRVRIYDNKLNIDNVLEEHDSYIWKGIGLPNQYTYCLSNGFSSFTKQSERIIAHGGASIEEVIVPFIHIRKEDEFAEKNRI